MNCAEMRPLLQAHFDHELDAASSLSVEAHLQSCATCAAEGKSLQSLRVAMRDERLRFSAPDSLKRDVGQFVREMNDRKGKNASPGFLWFWKALAAVAMAFALLTIVFRPGGTPTQNALLDEIVASHVRSLQVTHLMDVASSDQHTVKPWFDGKLDFAPSVKDFAEEGFPLLGGRLDYLGGRNVAALVYGRNKHFINVFVWPIAGAKPMEQVQRSGFSIITLDAHAMRYCLVSDLNEKELSILAELMAK
jgi:anti-sigma factor RsiW